MNHRAVTKGRESIMSSINRKKKTHEEIPDVDIVRLLLNYVTPRLYYP